MPRLLTWLEGLVGGHRLASLLEPWQPRFSRARLGTRKRSEAGSASCTPCSTMDSASFSAASRLQTSSLPFSPSPELPAKDLAPSKVLTGESPDSSSHPTGSQKLVSWEGD